MLCNRGFVSPGISAGHKEVRSTIRADCFETCIAFSVELCNGGVVNAATLSIKGPQAPSVQQIARETVGQWSAICQQFLERQRREILEGTPSPEQVEQYRTGLKWLLRITLAIHATAADPDYPDRRVADELEGRLAQLKHSWRLIHDRLPDAEAVQVLKEVFPE